MTKKHFVAIFAILVMATAAFAQQRYLLTPGGEAIPLKMDQGVLKVAMDHQLAGPQSVLAACVPGGTVGDIGPGNTNFGFGNGDVCLQRLIAPVTGVIESVYFRSYLENTIPDSSCSIRIFNSTWTAANPEPAGIICWGYYRWPSDPTAVSFASPYADDPGVTGWKANTPGAFDPNGAEIWGLGGYSTTWHRAADANGYINAVSMMDLGVEPPVTAGQAFNVNIRVPSLVTPPPTDRSEMLSVTADISVSDFVKFYYRGRTVGDSLTYGWWHREYTMNIWAVLRATGNVAPTVAGVSTAHDTLGSFPVTVTCLTYDCNFITPSDTGVTAATLQYNVNGGSYSNVTMTRTAGVWSGVIPAQPLHSKVGYRVTATDNHGLVSTPTTAKTYRIVGLSRDGYTTTNNATYSFVDITGTGTNIPVSAFFNTTGPNDDGTAGPFDMGGIFTGLFGRSQRYAWVGVNGSICLSNSPTDTVRVGNGYANYDPPTTAAPKNFIGAFWNDLIIGTGGNGSIWYRVSGTQFIVQWNHIGNFNAAGDTLTTFQMILDRGVTPQTIKFQYQNVGNTTLATDGLIALQDTVSNTSRYVYINRFGYPSDTRARNSFAIQMAYTGTGGVEQIDGTPGRFALSANYPNPFNPSTKINFSIPKSSAVRLTVHNILGQEVATLVDGYQNAGSYTVDFTPTNLASGVYFYKIQAGTYTDTKKMVLMK